MYCTEPLQIRARGNLSDRLITSQKRTNWTNERSDILTGHNKLHKRSCSVDGRNIGEKKEKKRRDYILSSFLVELNWTELSWAGQWLKKKRGIWVAQQRGKRKKKETCPPTAAVLFSRHLILFLFLFLFFFTLSSRSSLSLFYSKKNVFSRLF